MYLEALPWVRYITQNGDYQLRTWPPSDYRGPYGFHVSGFITGASVQGPGIT